MNIFLSGSSTILGSALIESFHKEGHSIIVCDNSVLSGNDHQSQVAKLLSDLQIDLVFLLHGGEHLEASIFRKKLRQTLENQIDLNRAISRYFSKREKKPTVIFNASSIQVYKYSENEPVSETSPLDAGGLSANFYKQLEDAASTASDAGIRVIHLRVDDLISRKCPPATIKVPLFGSCTALFQDNKIEKGWCSQDDAVRAVRFLISEDTLSGPVNLVSGDTMLLKDYNRILFQFFKHRTPKALPLFALRALFGEEYKSLFASNVKSVPLKIMEAGFLFEDISLQEYLVEKSDRH